MFGDKTELLIDRDVELRLLLKLNDAGFGAKVCAGLVFVIFVGFLFLVGNANMQA